VSVRVLPDTVPEELRELASEASRRAGDTPQVEPVHRSR